MFLWSVGWGKKAIKAQQKKMIKERVDFLPSSLIFHRVWHTNWHIFFPCLLFLLLRLILLLRFFARRGILMRWRSIRKGREKEENFLGSLGAISQSYKRKCPSACLFVCLTSAIVISFSFINSNTKELFICQHDTAEMAIMLFLSLQNKWIIHSNSVRSENASTDCVCLVFFPRRHEGISVSLLLVIDVRVGKKVHSISISPNPLPFIIVYWYECVLVRLL